jgi:hypothetical protein
MTIDHRIEIARDHFKITQPSDWQEIRPEWIRKLHGIGPRTLDMIRLYLAARGLTLKDDATVEFWMANLQTASIGGQIALVDNAITEDFTILIDSQEKQPWTFQGFTEASRPVVIPFRWQSLGPSHGDYSVAGCQDYVHIERKSLEDALGTFLSHGDRRDRWEATLGFLAEIPSGHVIIEATQGQCIAAITSRGKRSAPALRNEFLGSVISWFETYGVPFWFLDQRRMAERMAYRILKRGWRKCTEQGVRQPSAAEVIAELC